MASFSSPARDGDTVSLSVGGELDIASVDAFLDAARPCIAQGATTFAIDFGGVEFIDSSGLGALVRLHNECREADVRMRLENVPRSVARLLSVTGLDELFPETD